MLISVVIPALNEASCIEVTLSRLKGLNPLEIIVVDGGSDDDTREISARYARVLTSSRGRAKQMNAGAAVTRGDILLFLHADTLLPDDAFEVIQHALIRDGAESGTFRLKFDRPTPLLKFYSFCTRFRLPRFCFGDRALFVTKEVFHAIGGYEDLPIFEDLDLTQKLNARGRFAFLSSYVTTAARRFHQHGPLRQQLLNSYLWIRYFFGASPGALARHYSYDPPPEEAL